MPSFNAINSNNDGSENNLQDTHKKKSSLKETTSKLTTTKQQHSNQNKLQLSFRKLRKNNQTRKDKLLNQPAIKSKTNASVAIKANSKIKGTEIFSNIGNKSMSLYKNSDQSYYFYTANAEIKNLVFSGGGAKGVSYPGGIEALEEKGVLNNIENCYGSSVGSIAAVSVAIGLSAEEIKEYSNKTKLHGLVMSDINYDTKKNIPLIEEDNPPSGILDKIKYFFNFCYEYFFVENRKGDKLEAYLNYLMGESLLKKINNNNLLENKKLQPIIAKLEKQKNTPKDLTSTITFEDLDILSEFIPEIKNLEITATAIIDNKPQLVIFNKDNFADMQISTAARMSASFPRIFEACEVKNFLNLNEKTQFIDGGCILNTPVPEIIKNIYQHNITQKNNNLIFIFEDTDTPIDNNYYYNDLFKKKFAHDLALKSNAVDARKKLLKIRDQVVIVPTKVKLGIKTIFNSTLNFFISKDDSKIFQNKLKENVEQHLSARQERQDKYSFSSMEQLFHILSDKDLADINQEKPELCNDVIAMRKLAYESIENIKQAIDGYDSDQRSKTEKNTSLIEILKLLDQKCTHETNFINWFSFYINNSEDHKILRFLDITSNNFKDKTSKSVFFNALHAEKKRREHINKIDYIIKNEIDPKLYKIKQSNENKQLLLEAINKLQNSTTNKEIDDILQVVENNYQYNYKKLTKNRMLKFIYKILADKFTIEFNQPLKNKK